MLKAFKQAGKPLAVREVLSALKMHKQERQDLVEVLDSLVAEGRLIRIKGAYGLTEQMKLITGRLEVQRSGVGFVIPEDKRRRDVFINPRNFGGAWHGDKVVAGLTRGDGKPGSKRRAEGRIVRVLKRGLEQLTVRVHQKVGKGVWVLNPTDPRIQGSFMLELSREDEPGEPLEKGDVLLVKPGEAIDAGLWECELVEAYGPEDDVAVQEKLVKANHQVPVSFPRAALDEARKLPARPDDKDFKDRKDLRDMEFVTIDGAKAKDFDDAVYVERSGKGYKLWVAIADVSHYVARGSALDDEAVERGNSYYFPQSVEPMFPEALSNGLCSLNPNEPRLAMVAEMDMGPGGEPRGSRFYPAVIRSHARLTYNQVFRGVIEKSDPDETKRLEPLMPMLELAEELARKIHTRRQKRGSLDFDLPEPEILFNIYGETVDIRPRVRHFAHQIVEEFMIAANEAVAEFLESKEATFLYRGHPEPDAEKLKNLYRVMGKTDLGGSLPPMADSVNPKDLQTLLAASVGTDLEFLVGRMTLRSMMQANYLPENVGHFGLASDCYCHFTSPIRRYADLQVHRALKHVLGDASQPMPGHGRLKKLGEHLSARERVAMDAEREILKRITVLFLRERVGEEFVGVVNGLADFGFWVELGDVTAEGLVRLSSLTDDYYSFFPDHQMMVGERTGRQFKLGQTVRVLLEDVNLSRLEVTLTVVGTGKEP